MALPNEPSAVLALAAAALAGVLTVFFMCCRSKKKQRVGDEGKKSRATTGSTAAAGATTQLRARTVVDEGTYRPRHAICQPHAFARLCRVAVRIPCVR
jgi:hypothetical protein